MEGTEQERRWEEWGVTTAPSLRPTRRGAVVGRGVAGSRGRRSKVESMVGKEVRIV